METYVVNVMIHFKKEGSKPNMKKLQMFKYYIGNKEPYGIFDIEALKLYTLSVILYLSMIFKCFQLECFRNIQALLTRN